MRAVKWLLALVVIVLLLIVIMPFWEQVITGVAIIVAIGLAILIFGNTSESPPRKSSSSFIGYMVTTEQTARQEAELAQREAARAAQEAERASRAAEQAAWEEYRRRG